MALGRDADIILRWDNLLQGWVKLLIQAYREDLHIFAF